MMPTKRWLPFTFIDTSIHLGDEFVSTTVNRLVEGLGLTELPAIDINRARRIGIDDIPGLYIQQSWIVSPYPLGISLKAQVLYLVVYLARYCTSWMCSQHSILCTIR